MSCSKCNGTGYTKYKHIQGGVCFACGGTGGSRGSGRNVSIDGTESFDVYWDREQKQNKAKRERKQKAKQRKREESSLYKLGQSDAFGIFVGIFMISMVVLLIWAVVSMFRI